MPTDDERQRHPFRRKTLLEMRRLPHTARSGQSAQWNRDIYASTASVDGATGDYCLSLLRLSDPEPQSCAFISPAASRPTIYVEQILPETVYF